MSADGAFEKSLLEKETGSLFSLSADGEFVLSLLKKGKRSTFFFVCRRGVVLSLLKKGKRSTFFFAKKKKVPKKKLATLQVDGLSSMEALSSKARSLFANAYLKVHSLLGERNFAVHGSLSL